MGFEESAISSIRGNRSLQRKQRAFYIPEAGCIGARVHIEKIPVDEQKMQQIARRSNLIEAVFYGSVLMIALGVSYYWFV